MQLGLGDEMYVNSAVFAPSFRLSYRFLRIWAVWPQRSRRTTLPHLYPCSAVTSVSAFNMAVSVIDASLS
jgi:hypothetical protein